MRTIVIQANNLRNALALARRELNLFRLTSGLCKNLNTAGDFPFYRATFASGDVAEITVLRNKPCVSYGIFS